MNIAVTGAFGYSGRYIAKRLLAAGHRVVTLTRSPQRPNPFGDAVRAIPFNFEEPPRLVESLRGVDALVNTYWVRFDHRLFTHAQAVTNTAILLRAAKEAGVRRMVHISITNPDRRSALPYFRGKAELEGYLKELGVSYCVLRPTVLFGKEDVLVNNIAWALRRLPVFGLFGSGHYRLQPLYVDDLARTVVAKVTGTVDETVEAIGPETFSYRGLVTLINTTLDLNRPIVALPPDLAYLGGLLVGWFVKDVVITREEICGLMEGRLCVDAPSLGTTRLTDWIRRHRDTLGLRYTSEMARRLDRASPYRSN